MTKSGLTITGVALAALLSGCTQTESTATPSAETSETTTQSTAPRPAAPEHPTALPPNHGEAPAPGAAATGLSLTAPDAWEAQTPSSSMRHSQYRLPGDDGDAQLVVYYFGPQGAGSVEDNLVRWCGQFSQPDGSDTREVAVTTDRTVNGLGVYEIDVTGTYIAETIPGSGVRVNEPDWRLLGAIIDAPDGAYYVKLTGPDTTIETWAESFTEYLDSASSR